MCPSLLLLLMLLQDYGPHRLDVSSQCVQEHIYATENEAVLRNLDHLLMVVSKREMTESAKQE